MKTKTYRCLTCGFALTCPSEANYQEENLKAHSRELAGAPPNECPSCHQYLRRYGGRKNGKVIMPDIVTAGTLQDDEEIRTEIEDIEKDMKDVFNGDKRKVASLKKKYKDKKMFGFSVDDLLAQKEMAEHNKD